MLSLLFSYSICIDDPTSSVVFHARDFGVRCFRIPAIAIAKNGEVITSTDARWDQDGDLPGKISVMIKTSSDNGVSWNDHKEITKSDNRGNGDSSLVVDRKTGTILCMYNGGAGLFTSTSYDPMHLYCIRSTDNGKTWGDAVDLTSSVYSQLCTSCTSERQNWQSSFMTSGAVCQMRNGRVILAGVVYKSQSDNKVLSNYGLYSDDLGKTWTLGSGQAYRPGDEAKIVELDDGRLAMSVRQKKTVGHRIFVYSKDQGETWEDPTDINDIYDPECNGDFIRYTSIIDGYDKSRLLHTIPFSKQYRANISILMSYDEGKTWPISKVIWARDGTYSTCSIDKDGGIHVYYEKAVPPCFDMTHTKLSLEWLTDGADTYTKPGTVNWCLCEEGTTCSSKCPSDSHIFDNKVFDSYVESYTEYPKQIIYNFVSNMRNFTVDLAKNGLDSATYKNLATSLPTLTLKGKSLSSRAFYLTNLNIETNFESLSGINIIIDKLTTIIVNDIVSQIDIGADKVRLTKPDSNGQLIINATNINIINNYNQPLIVNNGISGVIGQEKAGVKTTITTNQNDQKVKVVGDWSGVENKLVKFSTPAEYNSIVVEIEQGGSDIFDFSGKEPSFVSKNTPSQSQYVITPTQSASIPKTPSQSPYVMAPTQSTAIPRTPSPSPYIKTPTQSIKPQTPSQSPYVKTPTQSIKPQTPSQSIVPNPPTPAQTSLPVIIPTMSSAPIVISLLPDDSQQTEKKGFPVGGTVAIVVVVIILVICACGAIYILYKKRFNPEDKSSNYISFQDFGSFDKY